MHKSESTIPLSDAQWHQINEDHPDSGSSDAVRGRAEALARLYILLRYPGAEFVAPCKGADMAIQYQDAKINFEVKGTRSNGIDWQRLKVSSPHSYGLLVSGIPMLRISSVFSRVPVVHTLVYPQDFRLQEEPRWSVHPRGEFE